MVFADWITARKLWAVVPLFSISAEKCNNKITWMQLEMPVAELDLKWNQHMVESFGLSTHAVVGRSFCDSIAMHTTTKVQRMLKLRKEATGVSPCHVT